MLKLVNGLERPVPAGHVEVPVDDRAILPAGWEALHHQVQDVLLVPQLVRGPELHVVGVVAGHLEGPVSVGQLANMQDHVGARAHVVAEVVHQLASCGPTHRIAVSHGHMEGLRL